MKKPIILFIVLLIISFSVYAAESNGITVSINGEVKKPGTYVLNNNLRLSSLLRKVRGVTDKADISNSYLIRKSLVSDQNYDLSKARDDIKTALIDFVTDSNNTYKYKDFLTGKQVELMNKLDRVKPIGKMPIAVRHYRLLKGSSDDIVLEDGDIITVPPVIQKVQVAGLVNKMVSVEYASAKDWYDYIKAAGGFAAGADKHDIYVIKRNGESKKIINKLVSWSEKRSRWEVTSFTNDREIVPGDTIVVMPDPDKIEWLGKVADAHEKILTILRLSEDFSYSDLSLFN